MSCLNVKATLLNLPVVVGISLLSCIECSTTVLNPSINVNVMDVTPKLKVSSHLVCSVGGGSYLRVSPNIVWLTPDMIGGEFDIYSNVVWKIDIQQNEDDNDIVSMLFNELMI